MTQVAASTLACLECLQTAAIARHILLNKQFTDCFSHAVLDVLLSGKKTELKAELFELLSVTATITFKEMSLLLKYFSFIFIVRRTEELLHMN